MVRGLSPIGGPTGGKKNLVLSVGQLVVRGLSPIGGATGGQRT